MSRKQDSARAIDESARATYSTDERRAPKEYRNSYIAAIRQEHPDWTDPPSEDALLRWRFCQAEAAIGIATTFGAFEAMALAGVSVRGAESGDAAFMRRRIVRFDRYADGENESPAARLRRVDGYMSTLPALGRTVLWLAYGPEEYHAQVRQRFGRWCGVVLLTRAAKNGCAEVIGKSTSAGVGRWLMQAATPMQVARAKLEAEALVFEHHNRWRDARGRRRVFAREGA